MRFVLQSILHANYVNIIHIIFFVLFSHILQIFTPISTQSYI